MDKRIFSEEVIQKLGHDTFEKHKEVIIENGGAIKAQRIDLSQDGEISSSAAQAMGGNLLISLTGLLHLSDAQITTTVHGGAGSGGNITIEDPVFIVLDSVRIIAKADEGNGGNIRITADHVLQSPDSLISASSRLGIDGNVEISAPDVNINAGEFIVSGTFLTPQQMSACSATASRFVTRRRDGVPQMADDLRKVGARFSYE